MTFETKIEDENEAFTDIEVTCVITPPCPATGIGYGVDDIEATTVYGESIALAASQIDDIEQEALDIYCEHVIFPKRSIYTR